MKIGRRETDSEVHTEKVFCAIFNAVLDLQCVSKDPQLNMREAKGCRLKSSNLTQSDWSEAHLNR